MKASDIGSFLFLTAFGIFVVWQSQKLALGSIRAPGPGFFSYYSGWLLIFFAIVNFVQGLKRKTAPRETGLKTYRVILALAGIFIYAFVLERLGYLISTFFLMLFLLSMTVKKKWWFAPALAGFISAATYILFKVWLKVLLPPGLLGL